MLYVLVPVEEVVGVLLLIVTQYNIVGVLEEVGEHIVLK
jgi:hypothetical protein